MSNWDAIVIGAGNGGLVAAARLAHAGKKTLLLERHNLPGGFATSFRRGRFEFEASLHELCGFGKNPGEGNVRKIFEGLGVADKIDWIDIPAAYRVITMQDKKNIDASMPFGLDAFIDKMEEYVPGSRKSMKKLFDLSAEIEATTNFFGDIGGKYDLNAVKAILNEHMNFVRTAGYSVNEVLCALQVPKSARDIFNAYWCYLGSHCDEISFIHYISMVRTYLVNGAVIPKARSHEMSSALLDCFENNGGEAWFNSEVQQILMENGAVKGIRLADGTEEYASHIICNASQHTAFSKLMAPEDVPEWEIKKANAREFAVRGFAVFLGLNKTPEELGITDHCYMIYDTADTVAQFDMMGSIESNNIQATVCLNIADPTCSPEGTTIMYFTRAYSKDAWKDVTPENYVKTKRAVADKMINDFEKCTGAKIRDAIEEIEISTPMTYARYTDVPQGVIYGYRALDWDGIVPRIMMSDMDEKIPGLRFAGGFGTQLIGYSAAFGSGNNAANATLNDMDKEAAAK